MTGEAALFVDLENIATSMWNTYQQAPDPLKWVEKVRKYGLMGFARAYGDFSQPFLGRLESRIRVAGIEPFHCPMKIRDDKSQSTVDINVAIDLYEVARNERAQLAKFIDMLAERRARLLQQKEDIDAVLAEIDGVERDCRRRLKDDARRKDGAS